MCHSIHSKILKQWNEGERVIPKEEKNYKRVKWFAVSDTDE